MKTFEVQFWLKGTHMTELVQGVTRTAAWGVIVRRHKHQVKFDSATMVKEASSD